MRSVHFGDTFTVTSPDGTFPNLEVNKCYIIKHGLYYDPAKEDCTWEESRAKFKVTFSTNLKSGKPQIEFISEGGQNPSVEIDGDVN